MNSTDKTYQRDCFLLQFIGSSCQLEPQGSIDDYNEAIEEYQELLQYAIEFGNENEMKQLRKDIQRCKAEKRILKRMIDTNPIEQEMATT